ncbi:protein-glutamate O-methyltransferase CheR [bacterium]|nr:protein-glutamate O-methyltransferase CheR [bacterium]
MPISFSDITLEHIDKFSRMLRKHYDIDFSGYNPAFLRRRIAGRINRIPLASVNQYYKYIEDSPDELGMLLQNLTINVSEFMRNPEVFDIIGVDILPELIANKNNLIRFWTAGCSKGEEPYSLAIILSKMGIGSGKAEIVATDIDEIALKKARRGIYKRTSLKNLSQNDRKIFFKNSDDGIYKIERKIKKSVIFKKHNILTGSDLGKFDFIMCRNVAIYFGKELQVKMYRRLIDDLYIGGYLIIGKSEVLPKCSIKSLSTITLEHRIYRKVK